jgi:hypothetical protein
VLLYLVGNLALDLRCCDSSSAFRLATNLYAPGVDDKRIQAILRHEDVNTTQRSYIKTPARIVTEAMNVGERM